jgi:hypothetical protein
MDLEATALCMPSFADLVSLWWLLTEFLFLILFLFRIIWEDAS